MKINAACLGLSLTLLCSASNADSLVGSVVPPYPEGFRDAGGACISKSLGDKDMCLYSLGILRRRGTTLLYIGKSAPRIDPKKARWTVTDQLAFQNLPQGHDVSYGLCEQNGVQDETILAIVRITNTDWYSQIHSAYKVNLATGRFEKIDTKGIRCLNEGWGA
jgi:hypothetical protein